MATAPRVHKRLGVTPQGLRWFGEPLPLLAARWDWFRTLPRHWPAMLGALERLGFTLVALPLPWWLHEPQPGQFDFTGPLDLKTLLRQAAETSLKVWLEPGPKGPGHWPRHGLPPWLVQQEDLWARTARRGAVFTASAVGACSTPSYAAGGFYQAVHGFLLAVGDQAAALASGQGPVAGVGFCTHRHHGPAAQATALDHHPAAIRQYQKFLLQSYGGPQALAMAHQLGPQPGGEVAPPAHFTPTGPLAPHLDWHAFGDSLSGAALTQLVSLARVAGFEEVFFSAQVSATALPPLAAAVQGVHLLCVDGPAVLWPHTLQALSGWGALREKPLVLGPWLPRQRPWPTDLLPALGFGGLLAQVITTPGQTGGILGETGQVVDTPAAAGLKQTLAVLREEHAQQSHRTPTAAVLLGALDRELCRLGHALEGVGETGAALLGLTPQEAHAVAGRLGQFGTEAMRQQPFWFPHMALVYARALGALGHDVAFADPDTPAESLRRLKVVVAPCLGVMEGHFSRLLGRLAAQGALVVVGPVPPLSDLRGQGVHDLPGVGHPSALDHRRTLLGVQMSEEWLFGDHTHAVSLHEKPTALLLPQAQGRVAYLTGLCAAPAEKAAPAIAALLAPLLQKAGAMPPATQSPEPAGLCLWRTASQGAPRRLRVFNPTDKNREAWLEFSQPTSLGPSDPPQEGLALAAPPGGWREVAVYPPPPPPPLEESTTTPA